MEAIKGLEKETDSIINNNYNNNNHIPENIISSHIEKIKNENEKLSNSKSNSYRKQSVDSNQEKIKKSLLKEFGIKEKKVIKTFDYNQLISKKNCTTYYLADKHYYQKAFICTICDPKKKYLICNYCHEICHKKCRNTLKEIPKTLKKNEYLNFQYFTCYCGSHLKHSFEVKDKNEKVSCNMMELDNMLGISPYYCSHHKIIVCCICAVVCHEICNPKIQGNNTNFSCQCKSDFHSRFNELALTFPLESYKRASNIDVWPVQILNILFNKGKTFNQMSKFFLRFLSTDINFNSPKNNIIVNQFKSLLELFSDTFNRKFKTYYYDEQMIQTFDYDKLFALIKNIEVNSEQTTIIKFRLIFILLFIHLRKDFRIIKSLTTNDFMCNNVLQRLSYKKLLKSKTILTEKINEKYKIREDFPLKNFALNELYILMTKGMFYISVEENQDEFEIGLKLLCFMLKHLMFTKNDLILLIDSLSIFHDKFFEFITKEKNNIYSSLDIFNSIVEICYMITVLYNDIIIEDYLDNNKKEMGKFIHVRSDHSIKLLSMVLKNCELFTNHFKILAKPGLDEKNEEERKREKDLHRRLMEEQRKIWLKTTGVSFKIPENGGLFRDKIVNLNNETLSMFCLADNTYQKQLNCIEENDFVDYFKFCKQIQDEEHQKEISKEKSDNILYDLKSGLEKGYYSLFTSSYKKEENHLNQILKEQIMLACNKIKNKFDIKCQESYYTNIINENKISEKNNYLSEIELLRRAILNEISINIKFANSQFLLIEEGRELLINDLIKNQVDESLFKGFFFLTNIHFPNIINHELVKIFLDFLSLYFLTKRGIMYILTGKNLQVIQRSINRFRFDDKNKNVNQKQHRTEKFNINSIKDVLHFLCILSKFIKLLKINTVKKHKSLYKFQKSILYHFKNYIHHINTESELFEYKLQLKEGLEIFNNFSESYNYEQYEQIKFSIMELFMNNPFNFLESKLFQKWFNKNEININKNFMVQRKYELDFYFQFFEIMTKNTFYLYKNDEKGKKYVETLIKFIDLENLSIIMNNNPDLITLSQKSILLKFIRIFYLIDYLDPINILKKGSLLTMNQYKLMMKEHIIKNNNYYFAYNKANNNINDDNINNNIDLLNKNNNDYMMSHREFFLAKLKYLDKLIILLSYYIKEIKCFPNFIGVEENHVVKNYIKELIFATLDICTKIYYSKDISNKILPYYYHLILEFIGIKTIIIQILIDIEILPKIDSCKYNNYKNSMKTNIEYKEIKNRKFDVFNKNILYRYIIKNIFEIFEKTKINEDLSLKKYLENYDIYNEANFPPFSLLEVYDYEYFYQWSEKENKKNEKEDKPILNINIFDNVSGNTKEKLISIREIYLEGFRNISKTTFLNILSFESINKKIDFGNKYVNLFQSFINSTQSNEYENYRTLLCIMTKILFYDSEHIQNLFNDMIYDKFFFKNLNQKLNYVIVLCIYLSHKYELCKICAEMTDIAKLIIQFLQLLGEGFNLTFHENILKGVIKVYEKKSKKIEENKYNTVTYIEQLDNESNYNFSYLFDENNNSIDKQYEINDISYKKITRDIPLVEPNYSIYVTVINNLKRICHLMELNNTLEGEAGFDKLCILSTNIIDFLIEYIDTLGNLTYIIDNNFKNLFFGTKKYNIISSLSNFNNLGIISVFTMRIKDNYENEVNDSFNKYKLRKTMLAYMKIKYFQLLKAYLQIGNKTEFVKLLLAEHLGPIQLYDEILYYMKELINNLVYKDKEKYSHLLNIESAYLYKEKLRNLYMFEDEFRTSIEISVIFQISIIIAILEENYKITILKDHFEKDVPKEKDDYLDCIQLDNEINNFPNIGYEKEKIKNKEKKVINKNMINNKLDIKDINNCIKEETEASDKVLIEKTSDNLFIKSNNNISQRQLFRNKTFYDNIRLNYRTNKLKIIQRNNITNLSKKKLYKLEQNETTFESKFSKAVYKFLTSVVSKVEIKMTDDCEKISNDSEEKEEHLNLLTKKISKEMIIRKNKDIILSNINYENNLDNNIDNESGEKGKIIEIEDEIDKFKREKRKYVFFIKPYLSFHLSEQTKNYFLYNVNRTLATSKYKELISYSDYFLFEMMYNMKYINSSNVFKRLSKISFYLLQVINYILIVAENALLMYHYYRSYSLSNEEYYSEYAPDEYKRFIDIVIIIIAKLILILFVFFIWFYFKFIITFERNVIIKEDKNFIFRRIGQPNQHIVNPTMVKFFREKGNLFEIIGLINENLGFFTKIKLALIDSIVLNIDINVFVFSFILDIFFLIFGHPLILSIETLLIYSIFPELLNIFKSFTEKLSSLFSCLIFTYLIIYVYNYITIFYMRDSFDLGEIFHYDSESYITEPFCYSSLQCFLILINYGTHSGGGIGDVLPIISYKYDKNYFIGRLIYDLTFFIIIIMIMGNVTFGLIVDTFGSLRDETYEYENDRKNICFICQLSRDGCLIKNIDYEKHIKEEHNLWSYVDFLVYLHLYNANDFNKVEGAVWYKLPENNYGWIPHDTRKKDDD